MLLSLPWPAERAVEDLLDGTQSDPIVLRTNQEIETGERSIEQLELGRSQVFEFRAVELLAQLFASADLLGTGVATSCAIRWRESVGWGAVFEQVRLFAGGRLASRCDTSFRA
jgi:hypothetical protein